jgi:predicted nucleic-acid-binding protein
MTALDTNVLVRFLVEDDAEQTGRAAALIEAAIARDERLYVAEIVLCELVWVLAGAYRCRRSEIAPLLAELTRARHLRLENSDRVVRAIRAYRDSKGDFADYLIREAARESGCTAVATFDRALLRDDGYISP